jgi:hypothetical protein
MYLMIGQEEMLKDDKTASDDQVSCPIFKPVMNLQCTIWSETLKNVTDIFVSIIVKTLLSTCWYNVH